MIISTFLLLLGTYLLGSIPFAYIVARLVAGVDIRVVGDGNVGTKNTFEVVGKAAGVAVGVADISKGALAAVAARAFSPSEDVVLLAGACAVLGHDFPVFLRFQGGQGMAAMLGVFGVLFPQPLALALGAFAFAMLLTRNWDLSWAVAFVALVVLMWLGGQPPKRVIYVILMLPTIGLRKLLQLRQTRQATP